MQIFGRHFTAKPHEARAGWTQFFSQSAVLPSGKLAFLVPVQLDEVRQENIAVEILIAQSHGGYEFAKYRIENLERNRGARDEITLTLTLPTSNIVDIVGLTNAPASSIRLRHLKIIRTSLDSASRLDFSDQNATFSSDSFKAVFVGTTNICNASCPHCPTNKPMTRNLPQGVYELEDVRWVSQIPQQDYDR